MLEREYGPKTLLAAIVEESCARYLAIPDSEVDEDKCFVVNCVEPVVSSLDVPAFDVVKQLIQETGLTPEESDMDVRLYEHTNWDNVWKAISKWLVHKYIEQTRADIIEEETRRSSFFE